MLPPSFWSLSTWTHRNCGRGRLWDKTLTLHDFCIIILVSSFSPLGDGTEL
jgi:hypothetical protein